VRSAVSKARESIGQGIQLSQEGRQMERVCFLGRVRSDKWQAEMAPYFTELDGRPPDQGFRRIAEIFHLD
jgi:hypothetical protein